MSSRTFLAVTLTAQLAVLPFIASSAGATPLPQTAPSAVGVAVTQHAPANMVAQAGGAAPGGTMGTTGTGATGSSGAMPYQGSQPGQTMPMNQQFDPHAYRTTTDCLNAASAAGAPLSACQRQGRR